MISIYNKYIGNDRAARSPVPVRRGQSPGILENSLFKIPDLGRTLSGILPDWLDSSDLLLLLMLLFLYLESEDSDFLIILAVVAYSIYKEEKEGYYT